MIGVHEQGGDVCIFVYIQGAVYAKLPTVRGPFGDPRVGSKSQLPSKVSVLHKNRR